MTKKTLKEELILQLNTINTVLIPSLKKLNKLMESDDSEHQELVHDEVIEYFTELLERYKFYI